MTTEQIALAKKLMDKHGIQASDGEWTLVFLGVGYGMTEKEIESYLSLDTTDLLEKHEKMLFVLFGVEENDNGTGRIENPVERLQLKFQCHFGKQMMEKRKKENYGNVMQYILVDNELSAAQIEQLRQAVEAGMPEADVLEMAKNRKDVMEIRRCVEFYEMTQRNKREKGRNIL